MKTEFVSVEVYFTCGSGDVLHANMRSVTCAKKAKELSEHHVRLSPSAAFPGL
jgi:hypothetical protein